MADKNYILDRIRRKEIEIQSLEEKLRAAKGYLQALKDILNAFGSEGLNGLELIEKPVDLRPGSAVALAREAILSAGTPLHVDQLLAALGKEINRKNSISLTSALSSYVRGNKVFSRVAPNTFGLIEAGHAPENDILEPPPNFGKFEDEISDENKEEEKYHLAQENS